MSKLDNTNFQRKGQWIYNEFRIRYGLMDESSVKEKTGIADLLWNIPDDTFERLLSEFKGKTICVRCPCADHCAGQLEWQGYDCPCICHINHGEDDYERR